MKIMGAATRLAQGAKVKRKEWKDAYLWMVTVRAKLLKAQEPGEVPVDAVHDEGGELVEMRKVILIKTPTGQGPWTPQPEDLFAEDWHEVEVEVPSGLPVASQG